MGCASMPLSLLGPSRLAPSPSNFTLRRPAWSLPFFTAATAHFHVLPPKHFDALIRNPPSSPFRFPSLPPFFGGGGGDKDGGNYNNNGGDGGDWNDPFDFEGSYSDSHYTLWFSLLFCSALCCFCQLMFAKIAMARTTAKVDSEDESVWEVKGGNWNRLISDHFKDAFVSAEPGLLTELSSLHVSEIPNFLWLKCRDLFTRLMLPEGFPNSVTSDYLEYSLWRGVQGVASQINGVLATQALLYGVGLGKGAIPTAAAINWVLKDGIGYLSKIVLSNFGRHFDVNPKGWRLFADLLENAAFGLEMLTPAFPHLFVQIGAAAGASRSAAALIQASTRSCFYAGFAAQRNFAEVIAKGEVQGMASKFIGIMFGIALGNSIGSSTPLVLATFSVVTWVHMYCNLKSYQSIQLRTLNPYRASLVFSEYLLSGQAPPVKEVNDEEPLFPAVSILSATFANKGLSDQLYLRIPSIINLRGMVPFNIEEFDGANKSWTDILNQLVLQATSVILSTEAKHAAAEIEQRLLLGSKLSDIINSKEEVLSLFRLYKNEGYILSEHMGKFCVVLKENCSPQDMLKALFQVNYLYWLEKNAGIEERGSLHDSKPGGRLQISLEYAEREFNHVKNDGELVGWLTDGLIARPLPNRIRPCNIGLTVGS